MNHISENIATQNFEHVYLLYGSEAYMRRNAANKLCDAILPARDTMNRTLYQGKDVREGEIIDMAETCPMFAERRLIIIRESGFFKGTTELLPDYMSNIPEYLTMVFIESEVDKRSRLYKAVVKNGYAAEFTTQDEKTLTGWVGRLLKSEGKQIRVGDARYFLSRTGNDMGRIALEVDKLVAYTSGRDVITKDDIDALTGQEIENKIFDMVSAVASGEKNKALALYNDLQELKEPPMRILILIERQYRQMLLTSKMNEEHASNGEIAKKVGIPPFVVGRYLNTIKKMSKDELRRGTELCLEMEEQIKNGRITDRLSVELLLISLTD